IMAYATAALLALAAAVHASPFPQAVTYAVSPSGSVAGATADYTSSFGIAVAALTAASSTSYDIPMGTSAVSQIGDGQIQAPSYVNVTTTVEATSTVVAVSEYPDGQPQAPVSSSSSSSSSVATPMTPMTPLIPGGPMTPVTPSSTIEATSTVVAVSEYPDGQPQAPVSTSTSSSSSSSSAEATTTAAAVSQISDGQIQSSGSSKRSLVACETNNTLQLSLNDGILKDAYGRIGYIASNYQFQFDNPPQSGAIYTAGFSLAQNGSLALGGSAVWYRCLSGDFYNLYDRYWAAQCEAVTINSIELEQCS
ncbi:hypothetical protein K490DRAFT_38451, partial [Saccharata proteae CBS 121410]